MTPVRDDIATMGCGVRGSAFDRAGRQRFCSTTCRQAAWRRRRSAPVEAVVARSEPVYECPTCEARYLGNQDATSATRGAAASAPGGNCPSCHEPAPITDLLDPGQHAQPALRRR